MKFLKIVLVIIMVVSIASCKSDDDGNSPFNLSNANLAGTYDLTYFTENETVTGTVGGSPITLTFNTTADTYQVEMVYTESGSYTINGAFRTIVVSSDGSPAEVSIVSIDDFGTYQVNETAQTLVLTSEGDGISDSQVNTVTLFNETEFRFTFGETYEEDGDTVVSTAEYRFVRQ